MSPGSTPRRGPSSGSGVFFLLSRGTAEDALEGDAPVSPTATGSPRSTAITRSTSHFHMAIAMAALDEKARGNGRTTPDFVRMFKDMGVDMVHLAEFHGDGHPDDPGPLRLARAAGDVRRVPPALRRQAPADPRRRGQRLPRLARARTASRPLALPLPQAGLLDDEASRGPAVSRGGPRRTDRSTTWATGPTCSSCSRRRTAWPGRPTPGSRPRAGRPTPSATRISSSPTTGWAPRGRPCPPTSRDDRLGRRVLDLMDDMANWGHAEVRARRGRRLQARPHARAVRPHEHQLPRARPRAALRGGLEAACSMRCGPGKFFVTTGEVLIPEFARRRTGSGESATCPEASPGPRPLRWTFPLQFAELVSGDGTNGLSPANRPLGHRTVRGEDSGIPARPEGQDLGPAGSLGRRPQRGVHAAGLAVKPTEVRTMPSGENRPRDRRFAILTAVLVSGLAASARMRRVPEEFGRSADGVAGMTGAGGNGQASGEEASTTAPSIAGPAEGDRRAHGGDDGDGDGATGRLAGHAHHHRPAQGIRDLPLGGLGLPAGIDCQHADLRQAGRPLRPQADPAVRPGPLQRRVDALGNVAEHGTVDRHADHPGAGGGGRRARSS